LSGNKLQYVVLIVTFIALGLWHQTRQFCL